MNMNFVKENLLNIINITIYNIIITFVLYFLFYILIGPTLASVLELSELYWFNSIIIISSMLVIFILSAVVINYRYRVNKNIQYLASLAGSARTIYWKETQSILLVYFLQLIISTLPLLIILNSEINYLALPLFFVYLLVASLFFINIGYIVGYFTRRTHITIPGVVLIILVLFLASGAILPNNRFKIIEYFPTSILLSGGLNILKLDFNAFLIPLAYILGLDVIIVIISNLILNKNEY